MNDELQHAPEGPVLVTGGYGTVGGELSRLAANTWPLLLTGRTTQRGVELAEETGAEVRRWDLSESSPFAARVRAVVSAVNDPDDRVLKAAITGGVPYVDITRWTSRLQRAVTLASVLLPTAPVLFSSGWMGGVSSLVAAELAHDLDGLSELDISVRYDLKDRAGTDSVEFMDQLGVDFEIVQAGQRRKVMPLTGAQTVRIGENPTYVARLDTPEQFTIPLTLGAGTVSTRIGFSANSSTRMLVALGKAGFFRWGRGDRFTSLRRSLLYSPGEGGTAQLRFDAKGTNGARVETITDPAGQPHLTALGGYLALRRVLGADGSPAPQGISFPESTPAPQDVSDVLRETGIQVDVA